MTYLINVTNVYRVPTVADALALRKEIEQGYGEILSFGYTTKYDKSKEEEYQLVKVKLSFNSEKDPESMIREHYNQEALNG